MATDTLVQDQRRRPMEALERRFAAARAQLIQQQKSNEKDKKETLDAGFSAKESHQADPRAVASSKSIVKVLLDVEEDGLTYARLSQSIDENLLATNVKFSCEKGSVVDKLLRDLLQSGDSAQKYSQGSRSVKLDNWILLDNFVPSRTSSMNSNLKALQKNSKRSKRRMSMKQLKKSGALHLPKDLQKFHLFKPMHDMWEGYMMQLIKASGKNQLASVILTADLHGAFVFVAECKITSFNGVQGIMVRETSETFGIITRDDKFRVVPKKVSVFIIQIDCWKITLLGDKLISRNSVLERC